MKPTSVIFLILSVILIAAGVLTCKYAEGAAADAGVELFGVSGSESDGALVFDLSSSEINRLSLKLDGAKITVHGESDKTMVELRGFSSNSCDVTLANKTLTINNTVSLSSLLKLADSGVSFDGFRHYLNMPVFEQSSGTQRTVDIYLAGGTRLTKYSAELENSDLTLCDIKTKSDYELSLTGSGSLLLQNVRTTSSLTASVQNGDITAETVGFGVSDFDITGSGNFDYTYVRNTARTYKLVTGDGNVTNEDDDNGGVLDMYLPADPPLLDVNVAKGDIYIHKPAAADKTDSAA